MPVRFEDELERASGRQYLEKPRKDKRSLKTTEYDRNYKWVDSYKSPYYEPAIEQALSRAGVPSLDLGLVNDPPIQRRKKTSDSLRDSHVFDHGPGQDDYAILGDQGKFAHSVQYRLPKKNRPEYKLYPNVLIGNDPMGNAGNAKQYTKQESRSADEAGKRCPVHGKHSSTDLNGNNSAGESKHAQNGDSETNGDLTPPDAPRPVELEDESYKRKPSNYISRPSKPSMKNKSHVAPKKTYEERPVPVEKPAKKAAPAPTPAPAPTKTQPKSGDNPPTKPGQYREKRKGQMNEFVQTDLSKGVADSGQEAPADYAMKYRAGIAPPRPKGPKRLSEYQMQFKWKDGMAPSPLLAAEQIVYNSNPHLAPYSNPAVMPKTTEYKAAFKKYDYKPVPVPVSEGTPAKKAKLQRSKSMEVLREPGKNEEPKATEKSSTKANTKTAEQRSRPITPDRRKAAGLYSGRRSQEDKRLLRESQNPTHVFFPHGRTKNVRSEYSNNFKAPSAFAYEDGAWRGADPPHLHPVKTPVPANVDAVEKNVLSPSWYQEVVELRNKAAEYKMRARGTHFSRQHLAQLYAQQADLWDTVSNSSTLSALSLESAGVLATKKKSKPEAVSPRDSITTSDSSRAPPKPKAAPKKETRKAWTEESMRSDTTESQAPSTSDKSTMATSETRSNLSTLIGEEESEEGRVPTPKFRKDPAADYKWRHHLDRTTPAVGGALLTSPPRKSKASHVTQSETRVRSDASAPKVRCTCKSDDSDSDDSDEKAVRFRSIPPHSYPLPRPSQYMFGPERIQPVKTHTQEPVFTFLPEKKPPYIQTSARPMFTSTARPVMVPQVAARLLDPYGQYGVEEKIVDEPWSDGYINPVYLGEGEIMQPSARAIITPYDTQYRMVPRYVERSLPSSPEPERRRIRSEDEDEDEPPRRQKPSSSGDNPHRKVSASWAGPTQTYGLPTRDTHVLVDGEASTDRTLPTKYTQSPPNLKQKENRPREFDIMPTLRETLREMKTNSVPDDDVLSMSARSVASSCSLASEVLERARNRRDEFWGKQSKKSTRA